MRINNIEKKYTVGPKIIFFFVYLTFFTLHQYIGNFVTEYFDFSKKIYGIMIGLILFVTFFTNIGIATINDKYNKPKLCFIIILVLASVSFQLFFVKPYMRIFRNMFWVNMFLYLMFNASIPPLLDKIILDYLKKSPYTDELSYGKQMLFGSFGYLSANWILESLVNAKNKKGSISKQYNYEILRMYQAVTTSIAIIVSLIFIHSNKGEKKRKNIMENWKKLFKNTAFLFFILIILLFGISRSAFGLYLNIYYIEVVQLSGVKAPDWLPKLFYNLVSICVSRPLAVISLFSIVLEINIFFFSQSMMKRFGLYWPLLFAEILQFIRSSAYYYLNPHSDCVLFYICLIEMLKGVIFGLLQSCSVQIVNNLCPESLKTTAQMIYFGSYGAMGAVIAGFVFGHIMDTENKYDFAVKVKNYERFFVWNIIITGISISLCLLKYGFYDKKITLSMLFKKIKKNQ